METVKSADGQDNLRSRHHVVDLLLQHTQIVEVYAEKSHTKHQAKTVLDCENEKQLGE